MKIQTIICTTILIALLTPNVLRGESIPDFQQGLLALRKGEKWGFIDQTGKWAISPEWDDVKDFNEDGLAIVTKDKKLGFINTQGKLVVPTIWFDALHMSGGIVAVMDKDKKKYGLLNKDGSTLVAPSWDNPPQVLNDGLFSFKIGHGSKGRWGVIDSKGKIVAVPRYDFIWTFNHGLAKVNRDGKAGFINRSGEEIIPLQYDYVSPFSKSGMATVKVGEKVGIINTSGKIVFEFEEDTMTRQRYEYEKNKAEQDAPSNR